MIKHGEEFKQEAVRIALTSGLQVHALTKCQRRITLNNAMSITPRSPDKSARGRSKHGSVLSGNLCPSRVRSQWQLTPNLSNELQGADCFVCASHREGFGVAIVEAMSAGLYVIASDCEFGPSDLIDRPKIGQIVCSEDVDALASAMSNFVRAGRSDGANETLRRDTAAAIFGSDNFGSDNVVSQHATMLEAVRDRSFARRK